MFGNEPAWAFPLQGCSLWAYDLCIDLISGCGNRSLLERAGNLYECPSALHAGLL
jgi:hypothetical protein